MMDKMANGKIRAAVSAPSLNDINALARNDNWEGVEKFRESAGGARGYVIDNGTGKPGVIECEPQKEGPLEYGVIAVLTLGSDSADSVISPVKAELELPDGKKLETVSVDIPGRGRCYVISEPRAWVTLKEMPDGVDPTMENMGIEGPMKELAGQEAILRVYGSDVTISIPVDLVYDPNARLELDAQEKAIPFGDIYRGQALVAYDRRDPFPEGRADAGEGTEDITEDEEERGY